MNTVESKPIETVTVKMAEGDVRELPRTEVIHRVNAMHRDACARHAATPDDAIGRLLRTHPRLVAHLICESLGYFCPRSAANAVHHYKDAQPFFCEWYSHMAQWGDEPTAEARLLRIGRERLANAFRNRHQHKGYMAEYIQGRMAILQELAGHGPLFASWF